MRNLEGGRTWLVVLGLALALAAARCSSSTQDGGTTTGVGTSDDGGAESGSPDYGYPPGAPHVAWFQEVASDLTSIDAPHAPDLKMALSGGIGIAVGDIDGDGRPDVVAPTELGPTLVYQNLGAWRFRDVSAASGVDGRNVANGASLCDIDGDGDLDLFLSTEEARSDTTLFFYRNDGHGAFTDATAAAGFAPKSSITSLLCIDFDQDGLLDLYVAGYAFLLTPGAPGREDALYRNRGDGTFVDIASRTPINQQGLTWAVSAIDYDRDGDLDLWIGNDTFIQDDGTRPLPPVPNVYGTNAPGPADQLLRNDGPGADGYVVFTDVTASAGAVVGQPRGTMGMVADDFTGDGVPDYYLANYGLKDLAVGNGDATFTDRAADYGVQALRQFLGPDGRCNAGWTLQDCLLVSWGAAHEDFDLDGARDLLLMNGSLHGQQQPQAVWRGGVAEAGPPNALTPVQTDLPYMVGRAVVPADLDGDGDLDLVTTSWRGSVRLFENVAPQAGGAGANWLGVTLRASSSAPEGRGTVVTVNGVSRTIGSGGVLDSSAPAEARFGLGSATTASIDVAWPSGLKSHVDQAPAGKVTTVTEPPLVTVTPRSAPADGKTLVTIVVKPTKSDGSLLGPGASVTIDSSVGSFLAAVLDVGDGSYTRKLLAPLSPGLAVVRVQVNGAPVALLPRVDFH